MLDSARAYTGKRFPETYCVVVASGTEDHRHAGERSAVQDPVQFILPDLSAEICVQHTRLSKPGKTPDAVPAPSAKIR